MPVASQEGTSLESPFKNSPRYPERGHVPEVFMYKTVSKLELNRIEVVRDASVESALDTSQNLERHC